MSKNFLLLLRGKPASGKTTLIKYLTTINFELLDPDLIKNDSEFKKFNPRMTKNPTINVKKYCYLYNQAEYFLLKRKNVVWIQPWSRMAEIELTIRNFGYYFLKLKEKTWIIDVNKIIKKLPFILLVVELKTNDNICLERYKAREQKVISEESENRLIKTMSLFQKLSFDVKNLTLNGNETPQNNVKKITKFIEINLT